MDYQYKIGDVVVLIDPILGVNYGRTGTITELRPVTFIFGTDKELPCYTLVLDREERAFVPINESQIMLYENAPFVFSSPYGAVRSKDEKELAEARYLEENFEIIAKRHDCPFCEKKGYTVKNMVIRKKKDSK